jgi:glycosyltransferase involved in cell wall biosynthesis
LSGASAPPRPAGGAPARPRAERAHAEPRSRDGRVGLYLGSPEPYRGFDALIAGVLALPPNSDVTIAIAGPDPRKVPSHPALRALGRVEDVGALLASVDFLINVNRFSLFDLSTIEAVEAGTPLLLHAVGGNRAFERIGAGCVMLPDLEVQTIATSLAEMAALSPSTLTALGHESRECWERALTPRHMWERHLQLYDDLA